MKRLAAVSLLILAALPACQTQQESASDGGAPFSNPLGLVTPGPLQVAPGPGAVPTPTPAPQPTPSAPQPTPEPAPPTSSKPVVKVGVKVMFVVCDGQSVPGSENATSAGVGCKVHLDMTPKDSNNKPTEARGEPIWHYSDRSLVTVKEDTFTPVLVVKAAGRLGIVGEIDDVKSTELRLTFHPR